MLVISILLFWIPSIGPLIAGIVGGKKSGGVGNAIIAALLPAILLGGLLFLFGSALTGAPLIGFVAGAGAFVLVVSERRSASDRRCNRRTPRRLTAWH